MPANPTPRLSARDLVAPVAFFLGAVLLTAAVAIGPVMGPGFRKLPLDTDTTWVGDGSDGSRVLNRCSIDRPRAEVLEARVQQRRRIVVVRPSDADLVTLQVGTALGVDSYLVDGRRRDAKDVCDRDTLAATVDRVTVDRTSAEPAGAPSEVLYDDQKGAVSITDRIGFTHVLPYDFDADQPDLHYFDVTTRQTLPLQRMGTEKVDGRTVLRLRAEVPVSDLSQFDTRAVLTRPASWFGAFPGVRPDELLTASLHHASTRDLFVDVATGTVIDERIAIDEEYRFTPGIASRTAELRDYRLTNVKTTLTGDRQSRRDGADAAAARQRPVTLTTVVLPIAFGVAGMLAVAAGVLVTLRRRRPVAPPADSAPE